MRLSIAAALVAALLVGCGETAPSADPPVAVLPVPGDWAYDGVTWSPDGTVIAASRSGTDPTAPKQLRRFDSGSGAILDVAAVATPAECARLDQGAPVQHGESITWVEDCTRRDGPPFAYTILSGDPFGDSDVEAAIEPALPIRSLDVASSRILTWYGSMLCDTIAEIGIDELIPISITVDGPGGQFDTGFVPSDQCTDVGNARYPAASPGDGTLAFLASTEAIGASGTDRLMKPFDLYIATSDGGATRWDLGMHSPSVLVWEPRGTTLLVSGVLDDQQVTVRVDVSTGASFVALPFAMTSAAFSSDGSRVVATRSTDSAEGVAGEVVIIDASSLRPS